MARLKTIGMRLNQCLSSKVQGVTTGSWRSGKNSSQRGYNYRWQKARERFLLDNPLCIYCGRIGRTAAASVVDHIVAHRGDTSLFWNQENWQALCKACHDSVKQAEEAAGSGD